MTGQHTVAVGSRQLSGVDRRTEFTATVGRSGRTGRLEQGPLVWGGMASPAIVSRGRDRWGNVTGNGEQLGAFRARCHEHNCERAISSLELAVRRQPANPDLHHRLGICYSGLCRHHSLVSPEIAAAELEQTVSLLRRCGKPALLGASLDALGTVYRVPRKGVSSDRFQLSITRSQQAAEIYQKHGLLPEWARVEYNLGTAWCEASPAEFPGKWLNAILHFENALKVWTVKSYPEEHALTLMNLGTVYREASGAAGFDYILKSLCCFRRAHRVFQPQDYLLQHADLHHNMGNTFLSFPSGDRPRAVRHIRRALRNFRLALTVRNREERPCAYAITQYSRGQAYARWTMLEPLRFLSEAEECFREAQECFQLCGEEGRADEAASRRMKLAMFCC